MITNKFNEILQKPTQIDPAFSQHCHLSCPMKSSSVRLWMDDLSFSYCDVKKATRLTSMREMMLEKTEKVHR